MRLKAQDVYQSIEELKRAGVPVMEAFDQYAESKGAQPGTVRAAYYRHGKTLKPNDETSLSDRLQELVTEVRDLEARVVELDRILAQLPR